LWTSSKKKKKLPQLSETTQKLQKKRSRSRSLKKNEEEKGKEDTKERKVTYREKGKGGHMKKIPTYGKSVGPKHKRMKNRSHAGKERRLTVERFTSIGKEEASRQRKRGGWQAFRTETGTILLEKKGRRKSRSR